MKYITSLLCLFVASSIFAQTDEYLILEGKIGKYPITMELLKQGEFYTEQGAYFGSYYYHSQEIPIEIYQSAPQLAFSTYDDESLKETFSGTFADGVFKGTWKKGEKTLPFELKKVINGNYTEMVKLENSRRVPINPGNSSDEIEGFFEYSFLVPKEEQLQKELIQKVYESYQDFDSYTTQSLNELASSYKKDIETQWKDFGELRPSFNHQLNEFFAPYLNTNNYLTMKHSGYEYSGGAHGLSFQQFFTYDKRQEKWLEISDVLDISKATKINQVLDKAVRKEHSIPEGVKLNKPENSIFLSEEIEYTKNFSLSQKGVTFHYGLYELTPYAYGYFNLFVSYEDLKPYLRKDFKY